jgi:diguanylate cyclase (GGDEF)-like protein
VRSHAADLRLEPGRHYELYLRVLTESSAILPLSLTPRDAFHQREERVQMAQGLIFGLAGALLAYSLAHWFSLGSRLFAFYAFMLIGSGTFFLVFFGVAQQHLGLVLDGVWRKLPPMSVLMALVAGGQFVSLALETRQDHPRLHRGLMAISALAAFSLLASLSGLVDYRLSALSSTLLGTVMVVVSIPAAWQRARAGDRVGIYMLAGWGAYMIGAITMAALLRGLLPARPWTMNLFQWGWLVEMLFWVRVLGVHIASVRHAAEAADAERKAMAALAHSDPLTGLPNRRGLEAALALRLADARGTAAVAVYLLDLDGFKPVNDRLGHEAGDRLLVHVSERLRRQLRPNDVVARLGGDEFVVVVGGLPATADADRVGHKLLAAFDEPFGVQQQACRVGATIGYSMVRRPGTTAGELLRQADAAMYAGKQAGRGVVRPFQVAAAPAVAGKPFKPEVTDAAADIGATAAAGAARPRAASPADNALA